MTTKISLEDKTKKQWRTEILERLDKANKDIVIWEKINKGNTFQRLFYKTMFFRGRFIKYLWQKNLSKIIKSRSILGKSLFCVLPEHAYWPLFGMLPDEAEVRLTRFLINNLSSEAVFFDVGANIGFYSCLADITIGSAGSIHAFEPTPEIMSLLKANLSGSDKVVFNQMAMSRTNGEVVFNVNKNNSVANSISAPLENSTKITVKTMSVDSYCASKKVSPDIIKIDAEGSEYDILLGADDVLKSKKIIICFEATEKNLEKLKEIYSYLGGLGYSPYIIDENGRPKEISQTEINQNLFISRGINHDNIVFRNNH